MCLIKTLKTILLALSKWRWHEGYTGFGFFFLYICFDIFSFNYFSFPFIGIFFFSSFIYSTIFPLSTHFSIRLMKGGGRAFSIIIVTVLCSFISFPFCFKKKKTFILYFFAYNSFYIFFSFFPFIILHFFPNFSLLVPFFPFFLFHPTVSFLFHFLSKLYFSPSFFNTLFSFLFFIQTSVYTFLFYSIFFFSLFFHPILVFPLNFLSNL